MKVSSLESLAVSILTGCVALVLIPQAVSGSARRVSAEQRDVIITLLWWPEYCQLHRGSLNCAGASFRGFVVSDVSDSISGDKKHVCGATNPGELVIKPRWRNSIPDDSLIRQLWINHGLCSGLSPEKYFAGVARITRSIRVSSPFLNPVNHFTETEKGVRVAFGESNGFSNDDIAVDCQNNFLSGVRVRLGASVTSDSESPRSLNSTCTGVINVIAYMPLAE